MEYSKQQQTTFNQSISTNTVAIAEIAGRNKIELPNWIEHVREAAI
jgi:hypothetical protein